MDIEAIKGKNDLSYEHLKQHYIFKEEDEVDRDCTLFLGYEPGQPLEYAAILLLRFHKMEPTVPHADSRQLLYALEKYLKNNKLERRRSGGSSGPLCYSSELLQMLATSNSSPKRSKACCYLRGLDEKWHLIYINHKEGSVKLAWYTNPVRGGHFPMDGKLMKLYPVLQRFVSTKPYAALLMLEVQKYLATQGINVSINPVAVQGELLNIDAARYHIKKVKDDHIKQTGKCLHREPRDLLFYQWYCRHFLMFTLVMHAVGAHIDVFADNVPSLENRVCFSFPAKYRGGRCGRGGFGLEEYTWALLDWGNYRRRRRAVWAHGCGVVVGTREPWSCVGVSVRIAVVVVVAAIARNG